MKIAFKKWFTLALAIIMVVSVFNIPLTSVAASVTAQEYTMTFDEDGVSDFYSDSNTLGSNYSIVEQDGNNVLKYSSTGSYYKKYALLYDIDAFNNSTSTGKWKKCAGMIKHTESAVYKISFKYKVASAHANYGTSVSLAVVGYGWQEVSADNNKNNGLANKQLFKAIAACDWTEYEAFVTLDTTGATATEGLTYGLALGGYITGEIYFDDIKIERYADISSNMVFVQTDTSLGSFAIRNTEAMPKPAEENADFAGWYKDETCTIPFDLTKYGNGEFVNAYAKWGNIPTYSLTFEEDSIPYYYPGTSNSISHNSQFVLTSESNNHFMRYTSNEYIEKRFALYDPQKINANPLTSNLTEGTRSYSITASNSDTNNKMIYRVSFKYRINSIAGGAVKFSLVTFNAANLSGVSTTTSLHTDSSQSVNGWENCSVDIYVDASTANWNLKCLGLKVYGNAQVDIDDIVIKDYTPTEYTLINYHVGGENTKSEIVIPADFKPQATLFGWFTDEDCTTVFTNLKNRTESSADNMVQNIYTKDSPQVQGDLNGDLVVNADDVVLIIETLLSSKTVTIYDYNLDGKFNILDLVVLKKHLVLIASKKINQAYKPSALTVTMYDTASNTYGFTWNTNSLSENSVLQISEGSTFDPNNCQEYKPTIFTESTYVNADDYGNLIADVNISYYVYKSEVQLTAGKNYTYRIYDKLLNLSTDSYKLQARNPQSPSFTFVHISDSQVNTTDALIKNDNTAIPFNNTLCGIYSSNSNVDFLLHTGDFVEFSKYESFWRKMIDYNSEYLATTPVMAISGNHETTYRNGINETYKHFNYNIPTQNTQKGIFYSYDYGNVRFIMLNTNRLTSDKLTSDQYSWLESVLKNNTQQWTIVSMHEPMYSVGVWGASSEKNSISLALRSQLGDLFANYGVDLVLQGHDHTYSKTYPIGIGGIADLSPTYQTIDSVNYTVDPTGVIYAMHGPAGNQTRTTYAVDENIYELAGDSFASSWAEITVDDNKLTVNIKYYNNGAVQIWNSYGILKN